jgi:hypothetical protein
MKRKGKCGDIAQKWPYGRCFYFEHLWLGPYINGDIVPPI